ncbi:MAG: glycosyltransferase [Solobacterium sp.]|nr:glycosyltransferase [Solobacterium sp.]
MKGLRFSVITVCYNAEAVIEPTIQSVLNQEYVPYEYLILDGASADRTVSIAERYRSAFEAKGIAYTVASEKDTGIYNAMNKGIRLASGDFISFLNAGDTYLPSALSDVNAFYAEEPFDLTYGGLNYINPDGSVTVKMSRIDRFPISSRHWNHPSMFLRREIYQKYFFDETYRYYADFHLYTRLRKTDIRIRVIPKIITNFPADGISTDTRLSSVLKRATEKYRAYRDNGYSRIYWLESYGWELIKSIYFRIRSE